MSAEGAALGKANWSLLALPPGPHKKISLPGDLRVNLWAQQGVGGSQDVGTAGSRGVSHIPPFNLCLYKENLVGFCLFVCWFFSCLFLWPHLGIWNFPG